MSEMSTIARRLVEEAKQLAREIDEFDDPPSGTQIDAVQSSLTALQRHLNRIQTETDTWAEETEAV